MEAVQLFLNINKPGLNNEWNSKITTALKELCSIEQVQVIEENEHSNALISMNYNVQEVSINEIEKIVTDSGAYITDINIHFPSGISGTSDPYGSSAISIPLEENLKNVYGVLGSGISSGGIIKVTLNHTLNNKQIAIEEIIKNILSIRSGNS